MKDKKIVLAFIDWYRPGYKAGGTVTSFGNFVDYLESFFDFKIVTRDTDFLETKVYPKIHSDAWNKMNDSQCYYFSKSNLSYSTIKKIILNSDYDFIYVNGLFSYYFSILPVFFSKKENCILNPHGMLSDQAFSVKSFKKKIFLKLANTFKIYKHVVFHVSNEDEAIAVRKRIQVFKSIEIANQFPRKLKYIAQVKEKKQNPVRFINVARISIEKGTLVMLKALNFIIEPLELDLYGPIYDEAYWLKCQEVISGLPKHIKVTYKGFINNEAIPMTLTKYDFFVLLSEGENFGHAIIEALSVGLPVLISNKTPWKDLKSKCIGWDMDITNESNIIINFNEAIKMPNEVYEKWSSTATKFVIDFTLNTEVIEQNKALFLNT
ncbi:Glycosyl transferase, group 1 [Winogradskyella psychrotolerans RS-3]|uniref:Glycosyl transferase, group 1 n=1 Tax=Winogradskyella psychrotolerans RS-3 TaxID=641526 RepID=S7VWW4_9FLAO|nr:glycosyltransferase family 4 protein [Winogradskyella psychrotolerans]EPR74760.1 Glycosyl transferase, group 1 [Winogradskyella psychrotolerans RS-3]